MTALDDSHFEALTFGATARSSTGRRASWRLGGGGAAGHRGLRRRAARGLAASSQPGRSGASALPGHPRPLPARGRRPLRVRGGRDDGRRVLGLGRRVAGLPGLRPPPRSSTSFRLGVITNCDDDLFARLGHPAPDDVRLGRGPRSRPAPTSPTNGPSRSPSSGSACRWTASSTSPRACSTTMCRPGAWALDGLDRSSARSTWVRCDTAGRGDAGRHGFPDMASFAAAAVAG